MKNNKANSTINTNGLSRQEIAESHIISNEKTLSDQEHKEFLKKRLQLINGRTQEELIISNLLQLKYEVEIYQELGAYSEKYSFSSCFKRYVKILDKTGVVISKELDIHKTKMSRIINGKEEPSAQFAYKLEEHSGGVLPTLFWWKLVTLKKEFDLVNNKSDRSKAIRRVKSAVRIKDKVGS